jgi:hypothetical protein
MQAQTQAVKQLAIQYIQEQAQDKQLAWFNRSLNIDHKRRVCFIHNPKAMGTSIKAWLGLAIDNADHRFPTLMVNRDLWERYLTILVVRHPLDRFLSSYHFHCKSDYAGGYLRRYPDLKSLDMETYFHRMVQNDPYALAPQWKYALHLLSEHPIDVLIKMGTHSNPLESLGNRLGLKTPVPTHNQATGNRPVLESCFRDELVDFYQRDFQQFGFTP